jgi:RNA polymerase sigma-70 factor (ECF subfamily)
MMKECQRMNLFENVCNLYEKEFQRYIYSLTRNDRFDMEEIFQNTMLCALKGLPDLRDSSRMKSWIFAIAKAEAGRYYAAKQAEGRYEAGLTPDEELKSQTVIDFTKRIENREYLKSLIRNLSEKEKKLYILHYCYGISLKRISELSHSNYNTVRSMHVRGMEKMRRKFDDFAETPHGKMSLSPSQGASCK